ncbi:MAG: LysR family transcriptional regulator [Clostridia bacterium]|nr:LysR family transcriptional regulator [Clostridia bacterium]
MEFLQLRYFLDSARTQSLSATAKKHMVPASSVSAAIKRLEEELGCSLFDRTANRITLNENGRRLQLSLVRMFRELDGALDALHTKEEGDEVRILVRSLRAKVTDSIVHYKESHVHASFRLTADFLVADVGNFDIVIDSAPPTSEDFEVFEWQRQRVEIYAAKGSPLLARDLTLAQLATEEFVTMAPNGHQAKLLLHACERAGFSPKLLAQINDSDCFFKLIASGVAIGPAGECSVREDMPVRPLRVSDFREWQTVYVWCKRDASRCARRFAEFLQTFT